MDNSYVTKEQFRLFEEQTGAAFQLVLLKLDSIIEEMRSNNRELVGARRVVRKAGKVLVQI